MLKHRLAAIMLAIMAFQLSFAYAEENYDDRDEPLPVSNPYYTTEGVYDEDRDTYMLNIYLTSDSPIVIGAVGLQIEDGADAEWNGWDKEFGDIGYLQLNTKSFNALYMDDFEMFQDEFKDSKQVMAVWELKEPQSVDHLLLGTITLNNVDIDVDGKLVGFEDEPFILLDPNETSLAEMSDIVMTFWEGGEIDENSETIPVAGYYKGKVVRSDGEMVSARIEFNIRSSLKSTSIVIHGQVRAFNEKYPPYIVAYQDGDDSAGYEATVKVYSTDGKVRDDALYHRRVVYDYTIVVPRGGLYKVVYKKPAHVTCTRFITVDSGIESYEVTGQRYPMQVPYFDLFAGDISSDDKIKLDDRARFTRCWTDVRFNRDTDWVGLCDYDGDETVTIADFTIFKMYFNCDSSDYFTNIKLPKGTSTYDW